MTAEVTAGVRVASFVAREYDIVAPSVVVAGRGVESEVWRIEGGEAPPLCLKWFRNQVDHTIVERTTVMERLARRGLPFPRLHRARSRDAVATFEGRAVVVTDWTEGSMIDKLCEASAQAAAAVLAEVHAALAEQQAPAAVSPPSWQTCDVENMIDRCRGLRGHIRRLDERSALDDLIDDALAERIRDLRRVHGLRRGLPEMALESLHFDYTRPNLLFQGTSLAGVLDLKGIPGYAAWELGRLAFEPRTVVSRRDWLDVALAAIAAYQARRRRFDVAAATRTTILYNLFSLWGISARYHGHNRAVPTGHEDYWLDRHASTRALLASLETVDAAITS